MFLFTDKTLSNHTTNCTDVGSPRLECCRPFLSLFPPYHVTTPAFPPSLISSPPPPDSPGTLPFPRLRPADYDRPSPQGRRSPEGGRPYNFLLERRNLASISSYLVCPFLSLNETVVDVYCDAEFVLLGAMIASLVISPCLTAFYNWNEQPKDTANLLKKRFVKLWIEVVDIFS